MGLLFRKQDRDREAMEELKAAVVHDPRLGPAWLALGQEFKRQGNAAESDRAFAIFKKLEAQQDAAQGRKH
jgi:Tfp pilus assembly protein PilF